MSCFRRSSLLLATVLVASGLLVGCNKEPGADTAATSEVTTSSESGEGDKIKVALAKLSDEDRAIVDKQKICPVSGAELGSMDTPIKVHVKDRDVFICCEGCEDQLKTDPEKYLAKIPE